MSADGPLFIPDEVMALMANPREAADPRVSVLLRRAHNLIWLLATDEYDRQLAIDGREATERVEAEIVAIEREVQRLRDMGVE